MKASRQSSERDQAPTPFAKILEQLVRSCAGVLGAAFVDAEGETVDFAGRVEPFEIKIAAAHARLLLQEADGLPSLGQGLRALTIRAEKRTYAIRAMPEGYALALILSRRAFTVSHRALRHAERALASEAALASPVPMKQGLVWHAVDVEPCRTDHRRPGKIRVGRSWDSLDTVLGAIAGLPRGERGFRVRLRSGAELSLIRERGSRWYTDEAIPASEGGIRPP